MIKSVQFKNFKALRDCTLPLSAFTLIVGANGSGKSTALEAIRAVGNIDIFRMCNITSVGVEEREKGTRVDVRWGPPHDGMITGGKWTPSGRGSTDRAEMGSFVPDVFQKARRELSQMRVYSFSAVEIAKPIALHQDMALEGNGAGLAGVLDRLRDQHPERFEALEAEVGRWLPEFDRIVFETPSQGRRGVGLRMRNGQHNIWARDISQGTLLALAMLTLAYLADPPPIVGFEEPDRGIHPRLLQDVRDALYRLAYPDQFEAERKAVQVIATTHSPYMLDLFKEHPEEIVISSKVEGNVHFERLSEHPDIKEILGGASLGDVWYSGVLGGVPAEK